MMTERPFIDPDTWYAQLPTFYAATGALITDTAGRILLVKPHYRDHWTFPGGGVESEEAPHLSCAREVREELGLVMPVGQLLVVDWAPSLGKRPLPIMYFLFDCGVLDRPVTIQLQADELDHHTFLPAEQAVSRLAPNVAARLPAAVTARANHATVYLPSLARDPDSPPAL